MQNAVLPTGAGLPAIAAIAERSLASRHSAYVEEVQRLIDGTYAVVRRTGSVDPRVSDIVREAGSSNQAFYRHFRSKDELLAAILADGRRQLVGYLAHRMAQATSPIGRVRAWIEGVLAQATNVDAAERTRPFAVHGDRIADQFPAEQQASVDALTELLRDAIDAATTAGDLHPDTDAARGADVIYHLAMGRMHQHLIQRTAPARSRHRAPRTVRPPGPGTGAHLMERELMLTGIGGQGVQLAAQVLARAATLEGREVMLFGSYGGMMRGGNTDATLVVADGRPPGPADRRPHVVGDRHAPRVLGAHARQAPRRLGPAS